MVANRQILVILGPTATGKSEFAVDLAIRFNGEIISADAYQVYKLLNIGTNKSSPQLRKKVKHHLIDIIYPDEKFSAGDFKIRSEKIIRELFEKGKTPIVVGGSGLYLKTIIDGYLPIPPVNPQIRFNLEETARKNGAPYLYEKLKKVDPDAVEKIHPHNLRRIIRALEVYQATGIPFSKLQKKNLFDEYEIKIFGLDLEREVLYRRIEQRVDLMIEKGLVAEVKDLLNRGYSQDLNSLQSIGYKEIIAYLKGEYSLETAIDLIKKNTKNYARHQLTWWRKDKRIIWLKMPIE